MDRKKARVIFLAYGRPQIKVKDTTVSFSRQTEEDLEDIEGKTDNELVEHWKALVFMNEIIGQVSLNDMQRINLIELEFEERDGINAEELKAWFEKQQSEFDEKDVYG